MSSTTTPDIQKEPSMVKQKQMLADYFRKLARSKEDGKKVVYTFVPGNLTELIHSFDMMAVYPEINALQSGMRKKSADFISSAEKLGHSEDVCTYVKCDIGMMLEGNIGPTGEKIPPPDLLLLSYTGCFTFMKWFENLQHHYEGVPTVMLHVPYQGEGKMTAGQREYVISQIKDDLIPAMEKISGNKYDEEKLRSRLEKSRAAEDGLVYALESAKNVPSPIDAYFAGVYYIGPIFTAFRGSDDAVEYYDELRKEIDEKIKIGEGPTTPEGILKEERYRLVVEGPPNWTHFREFWKIFYDEGAVLVASTYTKVGGVYDLGYRHDPDDPIGTMADYCSGCYTNLNLPTRVDLLCKYVEEYHADGLVINSIKSCNSFSAGQLMMMQEVEKRTGVTGTFIESDLVDPRYFSHANLKNRLESYFQMLDQKRKTT